MTEFEKKVIDQQDHIIRLLEAIQHIHNPTPGFGLIINTMLREGKSFSGNKKENKEKTPISDNDKAIVNNLIRRKNKGEDVKKM